MVPISSLTLVFVLLLDLVLGVKEVEQLAQLKRSPALRRSKKSKLLSDNLVGSHCLDNFEVNDKLIIRLNDSIDLGAVFLNETEIDTFKYCLKFCCETPLCNAAVWDQKSGSCFLFDCGSPEDFYCLFDPIDTYMSGVLMVNRHSFEEIARTHNEKHETQLKSLGASDDGDNQPPRRVVPKKGYVNTQRVTCGPFQFACRNGFDCVAVYDTCNGIPQCADGSDEDPEACPVSTTLSPPPRFQSSNVAAVAHPRPDMGVRPQNVNQWGREGELFSQMNAGMRPNVNPVMPAQPNTGYWPGNGGPRQFPQFGYPAPNQPDYTKNNFGYGFAPNMPPQQQPQLNGGYFNVQNPQGAPQTQPSAAVPPAKPTPGNVPKSTTAKPIVTTSAQTTKPDHVVKDEFKTILVEDLKDEDFIMETPAAALFTLVVGVILTCLLVLILVCRLRTLRRRGRKRNVNADADGDYLVNGMYL